MVKGGRVWAELVKRGNSPPDSACCAGQPPQTSLSGRLRMAYITVKDVNVTYYVGLVEGEP